MGPEDADGLAGLDQQGLFAAELAERADDRIERIPGARRPAATSVGHQLVGVLGDFRVEVVHQHPHCRLLLPAAAGDLRAAGRVDLARPAHLSSPIAPSTARTSWPLPTSSSAVSSSGARWRSGPGPGTPAERT